jgi:hypothetical protein
MEWFWNRATPIPYLESFQISPSVKKKACGNENRLYICSVETVRQSKTTTMNKVTIKEITYDIIAELDMAGKMAEQGFYKSSLILRRPKGHIEFWAMRDINGEITLN